MKISLVSIEKEGLIRVATDGNITSNDFHADGKNPLEQVMGLTWSTNKVLLDMDKTNYIDSTAIGWLISCHKEFKNKGGVFVVHSVQPAVRQVLDLLKIGKVVPIVENEAARWQQWRQRYADSSRKTTTQMRMVFVVALIAALAFVARALLS